MSTIEFAMSDYSIFFSHFFFFLLLLVPFLYGSGSLDSVSLPRFFSIGFPISLLANLRRLPRPYPCCYYLLDDDACLLAQVSHDTISNLCTFVGRSVRFTHSYLAMNVLPFGGVTLFGLALLPLLNFSTMVVMTVSMFFPTKKCENYFNKLISVVRF